MSHANRGAVPKSTGAPLAFQRSSKITRSPPQQNPINNNQTESGVTEDSIYQCEVCLITDNVDKVCCDGCNLWSHFQCVHVTGDVANYDWFCQQCIDKSQGTHINTNIEVEGAVGHSNVDTTEPNNRVNDPSLENPVDVNNSERVNVIAQNSARSQKSFKSLTSTSSRRKVLALKRLEEEQQLQRLRDQEEKERRDEERRQREIRDKEYLDKKYSILEAESDTSLSYDGYDVNLNPNQRENIMRWAEEVASKNRDVNEYDVIPQSNWEDVTYDKNAKIIPQMSSTNVHQQRYGQAPNLMDDPVPPADNNIISESLDFFQPSHRAKSAIEQPVSNQKLFSNKQLSTSNSIDVQSSKPKITLPIRAQTASLQFQADKLVQQPSTIQVDLGNQTYSQPVTNNDHSSSMPINNQRIDRLGVSNGSQGFAQQSWNNQPYMQPITSVSQPAFNQKGSSNNNQTSTNNPPFSSTRNIAMNMGYPTVAQPEAQPFHKTKLWHSMFGGQQTSGQQATHQQINSHQLSSCSQPFVAKNQTFGYTTYATSSVGYSAPQITNDLTFVAQNQPLNVSSSIYSNSFPLSGQNPPWTSSCQPIITSQMPVVLNQQPIMSTYHQPTLGQVPLGSNQLSTVNYHQQQSGYFHPQSSNENHQSTYTYQQATAANNQSHIMGSFSGPVASSIPVMANYQSNQNYHSTTPMNALNVSNIAPAPNTKSALAPNDQSKFDAGGFRQLTAEQIAARHVIPKELPTFYGDPEDWLTFFSAYDNSTTTCGYNNHENLGRIQKALKGDAQDAVKSLLVHPNSVPEVMRTLFIMYGRPELIIESMIQNIQKEAPPKDDDLASIMKFAIKVRNLSGTIRNTGALEHLRNPTLINTITDKLPTQIQLNWAYHKQAVGATDLAVLGDWLNHIAEAASLVVRRNVKTSFRKKDQRDKKEQPKDINSGGSASTKSNSYVNTQVEKNSMKTDQVSAAQSKMCPACKNSSCKKLVSCSKFKQLNRNDRSFIVKDNKLCTRCLGGHHFYRCRSNVKCKVDGCQAKHHTLLHNHEKPSEPPANNEKSSSSNDTNNSSSKFSSNASHSNVALSSRNNRTDIFRIVPVTLYHKNRTVQTCAYLDDGSNMTTMEASLANELSLNGTYSPMCVDWAFGYTHTVESKIVSVRIAGNFKKAVQYDLDNVRTVKELYLPTQSITQQFIDQYPHLHGIPISTYEPVKPRILIGLQYSRLTVSLKTIEGKESEPLACKTRLGWVLQGPSYDNGGVNRKYSMNICECQSHDVKLHQLVKEYFSTENLGVKVTDKLLESKEIQRARKIMEWTTSKSDGRYETGLLWKSDRVELPDSYHMALKRLQCLEAKMAKDPILADNLRNQIQQFVEKKYIRKLRPEELETSKDTPVWYLPTFPAFNPKKPEKVRIVWDGAAKVGKISLNAVLLTGPDQLVPLPDILRRFRERLYAIIGDIKEMYHQIKIIEIDQNVQRFLWRDGDSSRTPDVYIMMVVTFGLTCSPSQAQFIKNKNAMEFIKEYPEAVNTIINNHYVDDMLDSEHTLEAAEKRIKEVKYIHKEGGFEIRNFISNSGELLKRIGEDIDHQSKNMNISVELGTERVLGMFWNTATDCFTFSLKYTKINEKILSGQEYPTKREVLRILMSVFDPLGLLANYLIYTKILLQEIWRSQIDWDDRVTPQVFKKWVTWIKTLPKVEELQIPRLYSTKLSPKTPKSVQLHIFVDASSEAYATAIYYRIEDDEGVDCCLVGAKTKVAPNKPMSIPRLELQGGVLGTRLASSIKLSQTIKIDKQVFWTDSQTVMGWINSEARKYNQFVAFRIGEILEASEPNEWRWIPSEHNVADEATKSKEIAKLDSSSRWYKAPQFLYDKEESWFSNEGDTEFFTEEEMRPRFSMAVREIIRPQLIDIERFSNWNRLLRAQAYAFRFIYNVRHKERKVGVLSQQELQDAENHLYRRAQSDCFLDEIVIMRHNRKSALEKQKEFEKSSVLRTYSPYLDDQDVIRMKGRIDNASVLSDETKRPIILPRKHRITKLIVDHYHRRYKHINHSTALNEIRQRFVIPALRVVMKAIRTSCQKCKNLSAEPKFPEMAELPPARLAAYTLPFTYVGIDYFGPLRVKNRGRKTRNRPVIMEKRWILLFTCLTTRAVWMEIAHSLDTNSCIMCIDNFILRKGTPREIYSDNGSSFHSSDKELSSEFEKMNQKEIEEKFTTSETVWKFNPPATPHMGGVWERLVRTVKSCLKQTMLTRTPNDEMLKNLIITAENIVNSRPLTYVSLESADQEALTPNHILLGSSNGKKPLADVTEKDLARNTYKAVQVLANNFWRRFVLEYMPTLTKRTKWFKQVAPIKVGDIVVVVDERNERNTWPKGIVEELIPGKRGIVRQVMVRTVKGIRRRSVGKLAILDVEPPSEEVKQISMAPVNGEGNVGQHLDVNAEHSTKILPDDN